MIQKLKRHILILATGLLVAVPVMVPVAATAVPGDGCNNVASDLASGVNDATGTDPKGNNAVNCNDDGTVSGSAIGKAAKGLVTIFSIIVGVVAIIMIIYGGFRYITSGGDSARVGAAKSTLIYAIIGLVIVALSQLIIHFVLAESKNITTQKKDGNGQQDQRL